MKEFELENWDGLELATAKFTLEQSEKYLSETIQTAGFLNRRATFALQAIVSGIILLIGFLSSGYSDGIIIHLSIIAVGILIILAFDAFKAYDQYRIRPLGNLPSNMLNEKIVDESNQHLSVIYDSLRTIQDSINFNESQNEKKVSTIHNLYRGVKIGLIIIVLYPLLHWLVCQFSPESWGAMVSVFLP